MFILGVFVGIFVMTAVIVVAQLESNGAIEHSKSAAAVREEQAKQTLLYWEQKLLDAKALTEEAQMNVKRLSLASIAPFDPERNES